MGANRLHRWQFWKAAAWRPAGQIVTALYGLLGLALTLRELLPEETQSKLLRRLLSLLPDWSWQSWVLVFLIPAVVIVLEGAYRVYRRESDTLNAEIAALQGKIALIETKPTIDFAIKEAFILPFQGEAQCFLRLSLHNNTDVPCRNPSEYHLTLKISGKEYSEGAFMNLQRYRLEHYKIIETYKDDERQEAEEVLYSDSLTDIRTQTVDLVKGAPVEGWLGFAFHYVPQWQADKEYKGQYYEDVYEEHIGGMIPILTDNYHLVHNIKTVEELTVTVIDAYKQSWTASAIGSSLTKRGRRIVPPLPPQDWE